MKRTAFLIILTALIFGLEVCAIPLDSAPVSPPPAQSVVETKVPTSVPMQTITVYFTNEARFAVGTEPYEDPVTRQVPANLDPMRAVLDQFFLGPTPEEFNAGLRLVSSGFTHVRDFKVENGIAQVYLGDVCANNGAAYSVGSLIMKNLSQFPQITAVKIYDENNSNLDPDSSMSSLPYCLEP